MHINNQTVSKQMTRSKHRAETIHVTHTSSEYINTAARTFLQQAARQSRQNADGGQRTAPGASLHSKQRRVAEDAAPV